MAPRKPRGLSKDEQDLWRRVADTAAPLHPNRPPSLTTDLGQISAQKPKPSAQAAPSAQPIRAFEIGANAPLQGAAVMRGPSGAAPPMIHMDRKAYQRLSRGKLDPEARIDLHGMTVAQAHPALTRFVMRSHAEGLRLVLVITGKGAGKGYKSTADHGPTAQQSGVLRHQVPHWLRLAPLGGLVLQLTQAHLRHGGAGAFYVYLRRQR